jgi:hypothetical protein
MPYYFEIGITQPSGFCIGKSFLDGGSRVGLAEAEYMTIHREASQDGEKIVCAGEQSSEPSISIIYGGNLDQLRDNWLLSDTTRVNLCVAIYNE